MTKTQRTEAKNILIAIIAMNDEIKAALGTPALMDLATDPARTARQRGLYAAYFEITGKDALLPMRRLARQIAKDAA